MWSVKFNFFDIVGSEALRYRLACWHEPCLVTTPSHHCRVILLGRARVEILSRGCIDADFGVMDAIAFGRRGIRRRKRRLAWKAEAATGVEE